MENIESMGVYSKIMEASMRIAVVGIGGVGGFFGGRLCRLLPAHPEIELYFVARGAHLSAMKEKGLVLDSQEGVEMVRPTALVGSIRDLPVLDVCLLCVKGYDLAPALKELEPKISASTIMIPLLNGVDIHERVRSVIHSGYLHPACVYIGSRIESPGLVIQRGPSSIIMLGKDPDVSFPGRDASGMVGAGLTGAAPFAAVPAGTVPAAWTGSGPERAPILDLFEGAGIRYEWKDAPFTEIWSKYVFIASFGLVTAAYGRTFGEVFQDSAKLAEVRAVMAEVVSLARARGLDLPGDIIEKTIARAASFPGETRSSFQRDVDSPGKADERDLFAGTILRMGVELNVPVPVTEKLLALIRDKKPD